jgi:xanthine/CO dehydrogenase XdhC/CoxF family maturation factor
MLSELGLAPEQVGSALHSPVGLDIGADGAEQIALAAISEIQAALNHRAGGRLREKAGPLHARTGPELKQENVYVPPPSCALS